jgi:hypothetical protein
MKLYHGTSESVAKLVMQHGLKPRGNGTGNWKHTIDSNPFAVYLTTAYAGYFAASATPVSDDSFERWAIIEVDSDKLNQYLLYPDEDFLGQVFQPHWKEIADKPLKRALKGKDLFGATVWFRENIHRFQHMWEKSVQFLGNCAYHGTVPAEAITKIALYDWKNGVEQVTSGVIDPVISIDNYRFMADKYQTITRWFMGEDVTVEEYFGPFWTLMAKEPEQQQYIKQIAQQLKSHQGLTVLHERNK